MAPRPAPSTTLTPSTPDPPTAEQPQICPLCKSSTYLNPSLKFLLNPLCYHTLCTSCVSRLFASGPAPCPLASCPRTLRFRDFRPQQFSDLAVEREVDVRRRLQGVFGEGGKFWYEEGDFEAKRGWDDYLELKEEVLAELLTGGEQLISLFLRRAEGKEGAGEEDVRRTATVSRKAGAKKDAPSTAPPPPKVPTFDVKGLKPKLRRDEGQEALPPYDPFGGMAPERRFFMLGEEEYENSWLDAARGDARMGAGGYDVRDYCNRAVCEAFAGLGMGVGGGEFGKEEVEREVGRVATEGAVGAAVGGRVEIVDVF